MTVPTTTNKVIATGNGVATIFPFTFGTLPSGDLVVTLYDLDGIAIPQAEDTNYTVQGKGEEDGGSVTFVVPPTNGYTVLIQRILPYTQPTDYKNQGSFYPRTHERSFDRSTMQIQQLQEETGRTIKLPPQVDGVSTTLPVPTPNTLFGWDAEGDAITNFPLSVIATNIAYGDKQYQTFTGTGAQVNFILSQDPASLGNLDISIDGVTQVPVVDYTYTGTTLTFTTAPANGAVILVRYDIAVPVGTGLASAINFTPPPPGSVATSVQSAISNGVPVTWFATTVQLAIDATTATQAAINYAISSGRKMVYFPGGYEYRFAAASASIDPGVGDIEFYGDGKSSVIVFEEGTGTGDINTMRKNLFRNNANVAKGTVIFRDLMFRGTWAEKSYVEGGGTVMFLDHYDEIILDSCHFENLSWMATACEYTKNVRVMGCSFDTVCRDMVRFRSSFNVQVIGNRFKHGVDDCVALHSNVNLSGGDLREGIVIADNVFEDTGGIKVLAGRMVSIHHNVLRRVKTFPIAVYSDVGSSAEANSAMFGVSICDNQLYDCLNGTNIATAVSQCILLASRVAEAGSDSSGVIPGTNVTATGAFPPPWDSRGSTYSSATNGVPAPFFYQVCRNIIARTLPAVANYSAWGLGQMLTAAGFTDPAVTDTSLRPSNGINYSGQIRKAIFSQNVIAHTGSSFGQTDDAASNFGLDDILIADNVCSDFANEMVRVPNPGAQRYINIIIRGNLIDGDPYHSHSNRKTGTIDGSWLADGAPQVFTGVSYFGVQIIGNKIRNVCRIVNNGGGSGAILRDNILRCAPATFGFSTSNKGIGNIVEAGVQAVYEHVDSDPTSATYGAQVTTMQLIQTVMPATGTYVRGAFIQAANSTTLLGWKRLTTGSAHVAGTDWKTVALT